MYATAGRAAPALLDAISKEAQRRLDEFNMQNLANMAWAYAAANHPADSSQLFDQRFARRCGHLVAEFTIENMRQLHQWRLWHTGERGRSERLPCAALLERCGTAFTREEGRPSQTQLQVGAALVSLGLRPEEEVRLAEGYSIDLVVKWRGKRVGVEVDGPSHFVGREPTGAMLLKRRQLRHLGWRLVSGLYWKWDQAAGLGRRGEYLSSLLGALGPGEPPAARLEWSPGGAD